MRDRLERAPWVLLVVMAVAVGALVRGTSMAPAWVGLIVVSVAVAGWWLVQERRRDGHA